MGHLLSLAPSGRDREDPEGRLRALHPRGGERGVIEEPAERVLLAGLLRGYEDHRATRARKDAVRPPGDLDAHLPWRIELDHDRLVELVARAEVVGGTEAMRHEPREVFSLERLLEVLEPLLERGPVS